MTFVALGAGSVQSQTAPSIVRLVDGRAVYVLGLRTWTVALIQDSLAKYSPKDSLQSHACAAVLQHKLGFADASAMRLVNERAPDIVFVQVREPQDSARVKYRELPLDTLNPDRRWLKATSIAAASPRALHGGGQSFLSHTIATDPIAARFAAVLRSYSDDADFGHALTTLSKSPNYLDRTVAALVLANCPERQATWAALLATIRESDGPVTSSAGNVLRALARRSSYVPAWQDLAPQIHAILDGTSLFMLDAIIEVLNERAEIGASHASMFLKRGGEMLVSRVAIDQPIYSRPAHALLVKLRGSDLGTDAAAWRAWVAELR